jgi:hypothetical protein
VKQVPETEFDHARVVTLALFSEQFSRSKLHELGIRGRELPREVCNALGGLKPTAHRPPDYVHNSNAP